MQCVKSECRRAIFNTNNNDSNTIRPSAVIVRFIILSGRVRYVFERIFLLCSRCIRPTWLDFMAE